MRKAEEESKTSEAVWKARHILFLTEQVVTRGLRRFGDKRRWLKHRLGRLQPARLDLYYGWGTPERVQLRGRALEDPPLREADISDDRLANLRRSLRLFETDELPNLEIELRIGGSTSITTTDAEGYFAEQIELCTPLAPGWHEFTARARGKHDGGEVTGSFLIPSESAFFGVVSDIDDTILKTHARNKLKMAYVTVMGNSLTRETFEGASRLYRGLERGGNSAPFFYVSRSAWNIHSLLEGFIRHNDFPQGPLLLRNAGLVSPPPDLRGGKAEEIARLLKQFPRLRYVLIGDSGQRDADIYTRLSRQHPDRIAAILIRDLGVQGGRDRAAALLEEHDLCPTLLFGCYGEAQTFCRELGLFRES